MAKTPVDDYIAAQRPELRAVLTRVQATVRKALPKAEEVISYQIAAYRLHERVVLFFAGWKEHFSLYPITDYVRAQLEEELKGYAQARGTVRFPLDEPVPTRLITRIAKLRAAEEEERKEARISAKKSTGAAQKSAKKKASPGPRKSLEGGARVDKKGVKKKLTRA